MPLLLPAPKCLNQDELNRASKENLGIKSRARSNRFTPTSTSVLPSSRRHRDRERKLEKKKRGASGISIPNFSAALLCYWWSRFVYGICSHRSHFALDRLTPNPSWSPPALAAALHLMARSFQQAARGTTRLDLFKRARHRRSETDGNDGSSPPELPTCVDATADTAAAASAEATVYARFTLRSQNHSGLTAFIRHSATSSTYIFDFHLTEQSHYGYTGNSKQKSRIVNTQMAWTLHIQPFDFAFGSEKDSYEMPYNQDLQITSGIWN